MTPLASQALSLNVIYIFEKACSLKASFFQPAFYKRSVTMKKKNIGWVQTVLLTAPTLKDNRADADRLIDVLKTELNTDWITIELDLLRHLPEYLRKWNYAVRCILIKDHLYWHLIHITSSQDTSLVAGLAVDLGTCRVVLRLVDLTDGRILAESSFDNPQLSIGPDILTRIHYAEQSGGLERLHQLIVEGLNQRIEKICRSGGCQSDDVLFISVAGNTVMTHILMGFKLYWIIREPYIPIVNRPGLVKAVELGIKVHPRAKVFIFPNIGSYFGGDLIAGILFSGMNKNTDTAILVDVGTNAEVVLGNANWLIACAGAAGPALEGGVTRMGMMAGPGVIDRLAIQSDNFQFVYHTIGDMPPKGICGSGLIDLAANLFLCGMIDVRGKLVPAACGSRLIEHDELRHLVVVPAEGSATGADLKISQADLDSLIRSKAAMYTILETITSSVGMSLHDLRRFYVAGTFGSFIQPESAIAIGMLPDLPIKSYQSIGNSSIGGATMVLTAVDCREEVDKIRDAITYLELNVNQEFMNRFSAAKFLPHTNPSLFPSVKVGSKNEK
jgi:uncharacterized 2Fe-2S/4Fe-4S cluster protein (DUF4445 family)